MCVYMCVCSSLQILIIGMIKVNLRKCMEELLNYCFDLCAMTCKIPGLEGFACMITGKDAKLWFNLLVGY